LTDAAPSNLVQQLVAPDSDVAQQVAKDPYNLEFRPLGRSEEQYTDIHTSFDGHLLVIVRPTEEGENAVHVSADGFWPVALRLAA
jgi:hypothetical protein